LTTNVGEEAILYADKLSSFNIETEEVGGGGGGVRGEKGGRPDVLYVPELHQPKGFIALEKMHC
jgi:hypothetical protein